MTAGLRHFAAAAGTIVATVVVGCTSLPTTPRSLTATGGAGVAGNASGGIGGKTVVPDASGGQAGAAVAATGGTSADGGIGRGSGGAAASGGTGGTSPVNGSGGAPGSGGGGRGTGGIVATGGVLGTGGVSPSGGSGGGGPACQMNATQCATNGLQTCGTNGQWGMVVPCGSNQACSGAIGSAKCLCASTCTVGAIECASSTSLGSCAAGPDSCNVQSTTACGGGLVCERLAPASCADPRWAEWPVPSSTSPTGYTDNGDGTVTDRTTGLMWEKTGTTTAMTHPAAVTYCATMARTGGHSDWRLPSKIELVSIVDYGRDDPSINPIFTGTQLNSYWSSILPYAGITSAAWCVEFGAGSAEGLNLTEGAYVRCVR